MLAWQNISWWPIRCREHRQANIGASIFHEDDRSIFNECEYREALPCLVMYQRILAICIMNHWDLQGLSLRDKIICWIFLCDISCHFQLSYWTLNAKHSFCWGPRRGASGTATYPQLHGKNGLKLPPALDSWSIWKGDRLNGIGVGHRETRFMALSWGCDRSHFSDKS